MIVLLLQKILELKKEDDLQKGAYILGHDPSQCRRLSPPEHGNLPHLGADFMDSG
jgi:hypothetical protein